MFEFFIVHKMFLRMFLKKSYFPPQMFLNVLEFDYTLSVWTLVVTNVVKQEGALGLGRWPGRGLGSGSGAGLWALIFQILSNVQKLLYVSLYMIMQLC